MPCVRHVAPGGERRGGGIAGRLCVVQSVAAEFMAPESMRGEEAHAKAVAAFLYPGAIPSISGLTRCQSRAIRPVPSKAPF